MATKKSTIDFILDRLSHLDVRARSMFGEYGLYCNEKVVAFVCDDQLFVKITPIGANFLDESHYAPAYPGSKDYLCVPEDRLEDREWLTDFIQQTADALPAPKPKKK